MINIKNYYQKLKNYKFKIFHYSDTNKLRIFFNILRLFFYRVTNKRFVTAKVNNYKMFLDLQTPGLSEALFVYGKREILDTYLMQKEIKKNMRVLDLGANIGYYALMEAAQLDTGKVYAFEPDPRNIELLRKNIKLNKFEHRIEVYPYAGSDKNENKTFYLAKYTNVSSFIDRGGSEAINVKCIKLDDFLYANNIDFIRMDIEGYECQVLGGARTFLTNTKKPIQIFIEVHNHAYDDNEFNFAKKLKYLFDNGFAVKYLITDSKKPGVLSDLGYQALMHGFELDNERSLYKNIKEADVFALLDRRLIRSFIVEKVQSTN